MALPRDDAGLAERFMPRSDSGTTSGPRRVSENHLTDGIRAGAIQKLLPDRDGGDREVAVERARVAMKGTGNWVGSAAHGLFRVQLLRSARVGQSIEVEVEGIPGWLLYQPADGRVVVPEQPQTVALKLLPKGSLRFLGSQGPASLFQRMMSEAKGSASTPSPAAPLEVCTPLADLKGPGCRSGRGSTG